MSVFRRGVFMFFVLLLLFLWPAYGQWDSWSHSYRSTTPRTQSWKSPPSWHTQSHRSLPLSHRNWASSYKSQPGSWHQQDHWSKKQTTNQPHHDAQLLYAQDDTDETEYFDASNESSEETSVLNNTDDNPFDYTDTLRNDALGIALAGTALVNPRRDKQVAQVGLMAKNDPVGALALASQHSPHNEQLQVAVLGAQFATQAQEDPRGAVVALAEKHPRLQKYANNPEFLALVEKNPQAALAHLGKEEPRLAHASKGLEVAMLAQDNPEQAALMAMQLAPEVVGGSPHATKAVQAAQVGLNGQE